MKNYEGLRCLHGFSCFIWVKILILKETFHSGEFIV